ncbi:unnamed protein product [Acidithrix sp. C25]|nr:unnamed protein product [Acidithrix sp. C25]
MNDEAHVKIAMLPLMAIEKCKLASILGWGRKCNSRSGTLEDCL